MSHTINVEGSSSLSYDIFIGRDLWDQFQTYCNQHFSGRQLVIIIDEKVQRLHGEIISKNCYSVFDDCRIHAIPEGEQSKSMEQWSRLVEAILTDGVERGTPVLAVGGGVTGDLGGFTASAVLRGLPLLHMPTSLLAMVDSSIGGKTGINHATGKNLIGAFYQPDAVFADVDFLKTLERNEWINGLGEVIKYGAIQNPELLDVTEQLVQQGFEPSNQWVDLIARCAAVKADIVQQDMLESGVRAYLNFGHTFAHALEKRAGFGTISHGEAVFVGMLAAIYASAECGGEVSKARLSPFKPLYNIKLNSEIADIEALTRLMSRDKKVKNGIIRLILLRRCGDPYIHPCKNMDLIKHSWRYALDSMNKDTASR